MNCNLLGKGHSYIHKKKETTNWNYDMKHSNPSVGH